LKMKRRSIHVFKDISRLFEWNWWNGERIELASDS
jgi:hypothetical protein